MYETKSSCKGIDALYKKSQPIYPKLTNSNTPSFPFFITKPIKQTHNYTSKTTPTTKGKLKDTKDNHEIALHTGNCLPTDFTQCKYQRNTMTS